MELEINAEKGTEEYSKQIFKGMNTLMEDFLSDLYEKEKISFEILRTNTQWKVITRCDISPRAYVIRNVRYFKTKELAERFKLKKETFK